MRLGEPSELDSIAIGRTPTCQLDLPGHLLLVKSMTVITLFGIDPVMTYLLSPVT